MHAGCINKSDQYFVPSQPGLKSCHKIFVLNGKPNIQDIPILDHILLAFHIELTGFFKLSL